MSRSKLQVVALVVLLVAATGMISASSFTTATLSRSTSIDVVSDTNGAIALIDGNSGDVVKPAANGELQIDFNVGSATGVNVESIYELGDPANGATDRAFNITNNDGVTHTITLNYTVSSGDGVGDGANSTEFLVFDSTGSNILTISEEDSGGSFSASSSETFAVVVVVDTTVGSLTDTENLSGTLNVTAT